MPWTAALDFTVTRSGGGLLSLHTDAAERHGTARPLLVRSGETWDLTSGTPVSLSSLFPSGRRWRQQVLSAIEEQCAGRAASGEFLFYEDWPRRVALDFDPDNFYLTEDGVVVFYPLHTLCPAAEGIPEFPSLCRRFLSDGHRFPSSSVQGGHLPVFEEKSRINRNFFTFCPL